MAEKLTLDLIDKALDSGASALRRCVRLQPSGGTGDKIFPPTYSGGAYATEIRVIDDEPVNCVLLDSVQSQANRMELALLDAWKRKQMTLPVISVDFTGKVDGVGTITSLEAPHRISDAILRDSETEGVAFRESEAGKSFTDASTRDATALFGWCPTALIYGIWDSTGPKGGLGAKFQRAVVSEIIGINVQEGKKTSSRIDPLQIRKDAGPLYKAVNGSWTHDEKEALKEKGKPVLYGKDGAPSTAIHGNIVPTIENGGFTIKYALHFTTISLAALRRLHFPVGGKESGEIDTAARAVLALLALTGSILQAEYGYDLRSRCLLIPEVEAPLELVGTSLSDAKQIQIDRSGVLELFKQAVDRAKRVGLPWNDKGLVLTPNKSFVALVKKNIEIAAHTTEGD